MTFEERLEQDERRAVMKAAESSKDGLSRNGADRGAVMAWGLGSVRLRLSSPRSGVVGQWSGRLLKIKQGDGPYGQLD
ncbi:MAG: hypothetical protein Q9173_003683 [Seirophora scorigena]